MYKIVKLVKYLAISSLVLVVSTILGQKNTQDYSFVSLVHADVPGSPGGAGCASDGDDGGADGGDGTDGTSSDGGSSGTGGVGYYDDSTAQESV